LLFDYLAIEHKGAAPPAPHGPGHCLVFQARGVRARHRDILSTALPIVIELHDHLTALRVRVPAESALTDRFTEHVLELSEPRFAQLLAVVDLAEQLPGSTVVVQVRVHTAEGDLPVAHIAQHFSFGA